MRRWFVYLLLAAALFLELPSGSARAAKEEFSIEPVIWEFTEDYLAGTPGDPSLPINRVYLKTHDGTDWMSVYDQHPQSVSGPGALKRAVDIYRGMGIDVIAWFVPKGGDIDTQVVMAGQVLDTGVTALYADVEPYPGFCDWDCAYLAQQLWPRIRAQYPDAELGVIYDPRPEHWLESGLFDWMRLANTALPMCYWSMFVDQPPWNDPGGCVWQARADLNILAPGASLQYVPMLQGDGPAGEFRSALVAVKEVGSLRASLWRRGTITPDIWATTAAYRAEVNAQLQPPSPPSPAPPPPDPCADSHMRLGHRAVLC